MCSAEVCKLPQSQNIIGILKMKFIFNRRRLRREYNQTSIKLFMFLIFSNEHARQ